MTAATADATRARDIQLVTEQLPPRAALLVRLLVRQVRGAGLTRTEMEVLSTLREGPRRITELAELESVAQPTMTVLVRRLQEKGWVRRDGAPHDGRVVLVTLTEQGAAVQQRYRAQFLATMRADLRDLSDVQLRELAAATDALGSFVDELQQRMGR